MSWRKVLAIVASCTLVGALLSRALGETWPAAFIAFLVGGVLGWLISIAEDQ